MADALAGLHDHCVDAVGRAGTDDVARRVVLVTDEANALPLGRHPEFAIGDGHALGEGRAVIGGIAVDDEVIAFALDDQFAVDGEVWWDSVFVDSEGLAIGALLAGLPGKAFIAVWRARLGLPSNGNVDAKIGFDVVADFIVGAGNVGGDGRSLLDGGVRFEVVQDVDDDTGDQGQN